MWCTSSIPVATLPEFWEMMVKGSAPIQMLKKNLGEAVWREKEPAALAYLEERLADDSVELTSDAWLGVAGKRELIRS